MDKRKWMLLATMTEKGHEKYEHHEMQGKDAGHEYAMNPVKTEFGRNIAVDWVAGMANEDGTTGSHWTMDQTKQVQAQKGINCDPVYFWVAMNMMYSDYCAVAKKFGADNPDFYAEMAKAFLEDKDAASGKLARYYYAIVKH